MGRSPIFRLSDLLTGEIVAALQLEKKYEMCLGTSGTHKCVHIIGGDLIINSGVIPEFGEAYREYTYIVMSKFDPTTEKVSTRLQNNQFVMLKKEQVKLLVDDINTVQTDYTVYIDEEMGKTLYERYFVEQV